IPDTDKLDKFSLSGWPNASVLKEACFNLQIRQGFYEVAYANLSVDCGPMNMAYLNPKTTLAEFVKVRHDVLITNVDYLERRGFRIGESPFFFTPRQKWIWSEDRADVIESVFRDLEAAIEPKVVASQGPRVTDPELQKTS